MKAHKSKVKLKVDGDMDDTNDADMVTRCFVKEALALMFRIEMLNQDISIRFCALFQLD